VDGVPFGYAAHDFGVQTSSSLVIRLSSGLAGRFEHDWLNLSL
jgi:hypothetical protein